MTTVPVYILFPLGLTHARFHVKVLYSLHISWWKVPKRAPNRNKMRQHACSHIFLFKPKLHSRLEFPTQKENLPQCLLSTHDYFDAACVSPKVHSSFVTGKYSLRTASMCFPVCCIDLKTNLSLSSAARFLFCCPSHKGPLILFRCIWVQSWFCVVDTIPKQISTAWELPSFTCRLPTPPGLEDIHALPTHRIFTL